MCKNEGRKENEIQLKQYVSKAAIEKEDDILKQVKARNI